MRRVFWVVPVVAITAFGLIQAVPYGRNHNNPPVAAEPNWDSPQTRDLAMRACYDCHSNETVWPWYSGVAPISWLVQRDVDDGREEVNFSQWTSHPKEVDELAEAVDEGMPPWYYVIRHPGAKLTSAEKQALADGLQKTAGNP